MGSKDLVKKKCSKCTRDRRHESGLCDSCEIKRLRIALEDEKAYVREHLHAKLESAVKLLTVGPPRGDDPGPWEIYWLMVESLIGDANTATAAVRERIENEKLRGALQRIVHEDPTADHCHLIAVEALKGIGDG